MLHQRIKGQLDRDPCIKDDDFPTRSEDAEAIVRVQKGADRLAPRPPNDFLFVGQTNHSSRRKIIGAQTATGVLLTDVHDCKKCVCLCVCVCVCVCIYYERISRRDDAACGVRCVGSSLEQDIVKLGLID
jgi:hypothetical protein